MISSKLTELIKINIERMNKEWIKRVKASEHMKRYKKLSDAELHTRNVRFFNNLVIWLNEGGSHAEIKTYFSAINHASIPALPPMLLKGEADAIVGNTCNYISLAKTMTSGGVKEVAKLETLVQDAYGEGFEIPLVGMGVRADWLEENKDSAMAFIKARDMALNYLNENPDYFSREEVKAKFELNDDQIEFLNQYVSETDYYNSKPWAEMAEDIKTFLQGAVDAGVLETLPEEEVVLVL